MRRFGWFQTTLILLAIAAGPACGAGASPGGQSVRSGFPTATPGGSISVWLTTTTPTVEIGPGQATTPIAPVATATTLALTAVAQTATAAAPTPTQAGIFNEPARCPNPGTPGLPQQSPLFSRYPEVIARYLSAGGSSTVLEAHLRSWGAIGDKGGLVRADRDLTADGVPEVFMLLLDPQNATRSPQPGDLLIFGCQDGIYRLLYQAGSTPERSAPVIVSADDLNGNYLNEVVYVTSSCAQVGCTGDLTIIEWNVTVGNFVSLSPQRISAYQPNVVTSDADGDGRLDISVTSGLNPDPAAGPQRQTTTVYKWDGAQYNPVLVTRSPAQYRIHVIQDGDDALRVKDYRAAIDLYRQAATDGELLAWQFQDELAWLVAFSQYRLMLAYVLNGQIDQAQGARDALLALYIPPPPPDGQIASPTPYVYGSRPGFDFATMADLFWQNYAVNRDVGRACAVAESFALSKPSMLDVLNSFGYANRGYGPPDMCP